MKFIKLLSFGVLLWLISLHSQAQYIERPEITHFHGVWISTGQGYDSVLLDLTAKRKVPIKTDQWDTGVSTDVLLMDIKFYSAGELIYRVGNLEQKYDNQYFVAIMANPEASNSSKFNFQYPDDNNSSGKGTLLYSNGIMQMVIDKKALVDKNSAEDDDPDKRENISKSLSIPGKLDFVKKSKVVLL